MKIVGSTTSPFVRFTRVVCEELGAPYEFEVTPPFTKLTPEQDSFISKHNPLMKVPFLVDDEDVLIDSRIIVEHLIRKYGKGSPLEIKLAEQNTLSIILGAIDAGILRYVFPATHPEINKDKGFLARSLERITCAMGWLNTNQNLGQKLGVPEIALICGLEWMKKRQIFDWSNLSHLVALHQKFCDRPSFVKTRIPDSV